MMSQGKHVQQVTPQRGHEIGRGPTQGHAVVDTRIVNQDIQTPRLPQHGGNEFCAKHRISQISFSKDRPGHLRRQRPTSIGAAVSKPNNCPLGRKGTHRGLANACCATSDQHHPVLEFKIHGKGSTMMKPNKNEKTILRPLRRQRAFSKSPPRQTATGALMAGYGSYPDNTRSS